MTTDEANGAIVTGAAGLIGAAVVRALCDFGFHVTAVDLDAERLTALATTTGAEPAVGDASDVDQMADIVQQSLRRAPLQVLVNNAAWYERAAMHLVSSDQWSASLSGVLDPVQATTRAALPTLMCRRTGAIVNVASVNAHVGAPAHPAYAAAKGAVTALTRQLAVEYGPHGIRVNSVSPGLILVEDEAESAGPDRDMRIEPYPLGRIGTPEDVAGVIAFLASPAAAFVTGVDVPVDGGLLATSPAAMTSNGLRRAWGRRPIEYRNEGEHERV